MFPKENIPPAFYIQSNDRVENWTSVTDPATNAAVSTTIVDTYEGVLVTLTTTGNSQTLQSPTVTAGIKYFTVANNDTSTNNLSVVANSVTFTVTPGEAQTFIWDGSAWGPIDLGITSLPVPYNQGGTGVTDDLANYHIWVDGSRSDTYTADGSMARPYKTVLAACTAINADVGKSWVMNVASGTYADNLTITGPRYLSIRGQGGVTLSGTILINSGVGAYDRIEFVGVEGGRAEKGPAMTISGKITAERTNDSLIYVGFHGCLVSGQFEATTSGTWVLQYENCRVNGAITGTLAVNTQLDNTILIESYGFNEFVGTISGIVSMYNCNGSDFYCTINTTPWFENRFTHCSFSGSVSMIPQVGANSKTIYVDDVSYKSLSNRAPTLTGATYSTLDGVLLNPISRGPAAITTFAGTVTAAASITVTFSSAADAILAGYSATNPVLGTTLISNGLTRYIESWTNSTTCVVDRSVTWAGTAITSAQLPIATFVNSAGAVRAWINAAGVFCCVTNSYVGYPVLQTIGGNSFIVPSMSGGNGSFVMSYATNDVASRSWRIVSDQGGWGWFDIQASTTQTGTTFASHFSIDNSRNILIGGLTAAGTSAAKVLAIGSGTAPTTYPTDAAQMWVADKAGVAGKAAIHMGDEGSNNGPIAFANKLIVTHSGSEAATANDMYGSEHIVTGAYTVTLPAAVLGMSAKFTATTAAVMTLDSNGADQFILGGTALTAGYSIDSDGSAYATCEVVCLTANKWIVRNTNCVFVDGGAS